MSQQSLFGGGDEVDHGKARQARDEAIDRVEQHAKPGFVEAGVIAGRIVAARQLRFTSEDVREAIGDTAWTHEPRAMGAVMRRLLDEGVAHPSMPKEFVNSKHTICHHGEKRVWISRVYGR